MRYKLRFLWNATKGHRLAPWRSPYLLWRIETYTGVKMTQIGFLEFWEFVWRERRELWRFLKWTGEMERYVHPKAEEFVKQFARASSCADFAAVETQRLKAFVALPKGS